MLATNSYQDSVVVSSTSAEISVIISFFLIFFLLKKHILCAKSPLGLPDHRDFCRGRRHHHAILNRTSIRF